MLAYILFDLVPRRRRPETGASPLPVEASPKGEDAPRGCPKGLARAMLPDNGTSKGGGSAGGKRRIPTRRSSP